MQRITLLTLVFSLLIFSCGKRDQNHDTNTSRDVAMVEGGFNDVQKITENAFKENQPEGTIWEQIYGMGVEVEITPDWPDLTFPKTITFDFGEGVTDMNGHTRTGIVEVVATGLYRDEGAVLTTNPYGYALNGYSIEGQKIVTNNGHNADGNLNFDIQIIDGQVTDPDGSIATWESSRNREWIEGESTTIFTEGGISGFLDDAYSLTGTASGVNRDGLSFEMEIVDPLIFSVYCKWMKHGILDITSEGVATRTLDYGDGECDSEATISVGNWSYTFNMW